LAELTGKRVAFAASFREQWTIGTGDSCEFFPFLSVFFLKLGTAVGQWDGVKEHKLQKKWEADESRGSSAQVVVNAWTTTGHYARVALEGWCTPLSQNVT